MSIDSWISGFWQAIAPQRFLQHFIVLLQSLSTLQVDEHIHLPLGIAGQEPGFSKYIY